MPAPLKKKPRALRKKTVPLGNPVRRHQTMALVPCPVEFVEEIRAWGAFCVVRAAVENPTSCPRAYRNLSKTGQIIVDKAPGKRQTLGMKALSKIPTFPYENRKMSVEGMKKQLALSKHLDISDERLCQSLGLGTNGQASRTSTGKKAS